MYDFLSFTLSLSTLFLAVGAPFVILGYRLTRSYNHNRLNRLDFAIGSIVVTTTVILLLKIALVPPRGSDARLLAFLHVMPLMYTIFSLSVFRRMERAIRGPERISTTGSHMAVQKNSGLVWSDIVLPAPLKEELIGISDLFRSQELFKSSPPSGLLFLGPTGTGKSLAAAIIASGARAGYLPLRLDELVISSGDRTGTALDELAALARRKAPVVVHLQEIDFFGRARAKGVVSVSSLMPAMLHNLDVLVAIPGVLVIGEASEPEMIEEWMTRPGRLSRIIRFQLPTPSERKELLSKYLPAEKAEASVSIDRLAQVLEGFSARALKESGERIELLIEGKRRSGDKRPVTEQELLAVLSQVPRG